MANKRPHGDRTFCKIKIGNTTYIGKVKSGTASLLGLTVLKSDPKTEKGHKAKGWKGTQSYRLLLASSHEIGGYSVVSVDLPVSPQVKFADFYAWAYKHSVVAGFITPWGIKYAWKNAAKKSGGKNIIQKAADTVGGLIKDAENAAGTVGDIVQGAESAASTIGGYIQGAEGIAGEVIQGAETLGGYLL
jgi:hypothetical protein